MWTNNLRTCRRGHQYHKSSDCPVCPICEKERKDGAGFLARISAPARRALEREGIDTIYKLSRYSEKSLLRLHGMGPAALPPLRKALREKGYTFKKVS